MFKGSKALIIQSCTHNKQPNAKTLECKICSDEHHMHNEKEFSNCKGNKILDTIVPIQKKSFEMV